VTGGVFFLKSSIENIFLSFLTVMRLTKMNNFMKNTDKNSEKYDFHKI